MFTRTALLYALFFALIAGSLYTAFVSWQRYKLVIKENAALYEHVMQLRNACLITNIWLYGTIESLDATGRTFDARIEHSFFSDIVRIRATDETLIMHQELQKNEDGVYESLSPKRSARFEDMRPGDRIAIYVRVNEDGIVAEAITFGNPL